MAGSNFTQDFFTSRRNVGDGNTRIGDLDRLWYDPITNTIRVGNNTAGGKIVGSESSSTLGETFETINKNLKSYPATFTYSSNTLQSIVYTTPGGNIQKTFTYVNNLLSSVSLSGNLPNGIAITKTFTYVNNQISSIEYS